MNAAPSLLVRLLSVILRARRLAPESRPAIRTRRSSRAAVVWFVFGTFAISTATLLASDVFAPIIRDPEYGWRAARLRDRVAEFPNRPLVLFVGSSRVGGAVVPAEWETTHTDPSAPFLFNMARAGSGPILQLMTLRRVYADGFRPSIVLLEYWPPVANQNGVSEFHRIIPDRIFVSDLPVVRKYAHDEGDFEQLVWRKIANPIWEFRRTFMHHLAPEWLPRSKQRENESLWINQDRWGWIAGPDLEPEDPAGRIPFLKGKEQQFRPRLQIFAFGSVADQALRESVTLAREYGARVGLVYLPESSEFRSWYPPMTAQAISAYLAYFGQEMGVPVIDCQTWLADGYLPDGFHLSKRGGVEFTRKLGPVLTQTFALGVKP